MSDVASLALRAVEQRAYSAPLLVLCAGSLSGFGPCAAPRLLGMISCGGTRAKGAPLASFAFVAGMVMSYAASGFASSWVTQVLRFSSVVYNVLSLVLGVSGVLTLLTKPACSLDPGKRAEVPSAGPAFLMGASTSLVLAPCCAPILLAIVASMAGQHKPGYTALLLSMFAFGHAAPCALAAVGAGRVARVLERIALDQAARTVGATLMLGLAAFYACLA